MNRNYILILLFISSVWAADLGIKAKNLKGKSTIGLDSSDNYETKIEVLVEEFNLINLNEGSKVVIDKGVSTLKQGFPDVPKLTTSIIVPDESEMILNVIDSNYEEYTGVSLVPSKGYITRDIDPESIPYIYNESYNKDQFYPENIAELDSPYILRDLRGQSISIYPVQYNPVSKVIRVYSNIVIDIKSTSIKGENILNRSASEVIKANDDYMHIYDDLFINSGRDTRFEYLSDAGSMLVICYDDFIDEMQPFVNWKNKKGIPTEIVGVNEIGGSLSAIQNFINNYYYDNNLTYLLLVGDINQIPTHIVNGAASDPSFGFIEGNDSFAEVIVGRFSANNPSELQTQIDRTLDYEINPILVEHFDNALGIGSNQGPGYGGLSDDEFNDLIWDDFLSGYTYESYEGIYDPNGSVSQGISAINEGVGIINYTGHAGPTGWGNGAALGVNDVNNLDNAGKLPFIFTVGCNPGEFNNYGECFCEAWMRATDANGNAIGSVGHLGSTISQSWEPPMHGQWAMNSILTESYENNISRSYGGISVNGCMHMNEAQGSSGINETNHWTIFGDPSLLVRTDEPTIINAIYNQTIFVGESEFVVDVGVDGALVALSRNNQLLSQAYSVGGVAILDISDASVEPGEIDIVITSFNTYPHIDTLNIIVPDGAYLVYNDYEVINSMGAEHMVQYGDIIDMNLLIENVGTMNTNGITVTVSSNDEYITMLDEESIIAYAIIEEVAMTENPISFSVTNNVPDGHMAAFNAILDDGDEIWNFSFNIEIHAPVFEVLNPTIEDNNGDNIWDAGEIATINVDLVNSGSAGFGYYPGAVITTDNPYITILSGENDNTYYGIDANSMYEGSFLVQADVSTPLGTAVEFNISWGYSPTAPCDNDYFVGEGCVEQANFIYTAIVGHPTILIWDPSYNHYSGQRLIEYFDEMGFDGYDYVASSQAPDVENYLTAFILLGIYPENYALQEADVSGFMDLLNNGGNIYLEGNDTWAFDMQTSLQSMFGLVGLADGTSDLYDIAGVDGTFTEGFSFSYTGGNSYIDQLSPSEGYSILDNPSAGYSTAVAYDNGEYRTIGASHELSGLQGENFNEYIGGVLEFFDEGGNTNPDPPECSAGDLNGDTVIDVIDIIQTVNLIVSPDVTPTDEELCAADVNNDSEINVLDVLVIINMILDRDSRDRSNQIAAELNLSIYDNKLDVSADGPIKGIQCIVKTSDARLQINSNLDMDVSSSYHQDLLHIVIYSLDGKSIDSNNYTLFETVEDFEVIEFIAVNDMHQYVDVYEEEMILPDTFSLKQNYPNPFNPVTNIDIEIGMSANISLKIYDISGREVKSLVSEFLNAGNHSFRWNGTDNFGQLVSSGVYIYTLTDGYNVNSQKMLFMK